jgi:hypothetical protein
MDIIFMLPLQGGASTAYYFTQGVAIGLGYNGLSARKKIKIFSSLPRW